MTADEYRTILKRLSLTQGGAAAFLGVNAVTSRRWATGRADIPQSAEMLLRLMVAMKLTPEKVQEWLSA